MGQYDIYEFLKKCKGKWLTSKEIANNMKVTVGSATNGLKKLAKSNLILKRDKKIEKGKGYEYSVK